MVRVEDQASLVKALGTNCNLFLGAGFSVMAADLMKRPLPVGDMLGDELRDVFELDSEKGLDLPELTTVIAVDRAAELGQFLRNRFTVGSFDSRYKSLVKVRVNTIFTTNIDDLPYRIFEKSDTAYLNDVDVAGTAAFNQVAIDLVHLHGSVRDQTRPLRFTTLDLVAAFSSDPDRWNFLRNRLRERPTLFLGYSLRDTGALQALYPSRPGEMTSSNSWIQVRPSESDSPRLAFLKALGFRLLIAETSEVLEFFETELAGQPTVTVEERVRNLHNIPKPASVPLRPLEDFFSGAAPAWSDIYAGVLAKPTHYRKLVDLINEGKHVIVSGIPASGKTTLLMQAAVSGAHSGPIIMHDGLTAAQAGLLVRRLAGHQALVLLDNVTNDIAALEIVRTAPNVTVVAADRDYNLGTVSHRLGSASVLRVTDLPRSDLQAIWQTIPARLRNNQIRWPTDMSRGVSPSLYEFSQFNITSKPLAERLVDAIRDLRERDPDLAELLLVACYVHYCRVPLSMDTIISYFGDRVRDYREIYAMLTRVGQLLHEYEGEFLEEPQDYFAARSTAVAEAVLLEGSFPSILRSMLTTFHHSVSPVRVAGYNTFRRRAYDSHLFLRAFPDVDEGSALYDWISEQHGTAYVLQQKALFLADRRRFSDAFSAIDRARSEMRRVNWTIENTYNKILFRANEDLAETSPEARALLVRALAGLAECFDRDSRKGMHSLVYADLALSFTRFFRDEAGHEFLTRARTQLEQAERDEPMLERPRHLLKAINKRFREFG